MAKLIVIVAVLILPDIATAQKTVSFPTEDDGVIFADVYGTGDRAVVLAHGGRFNKESWAKQARDTGCGRISSVGAGFPWLRQVKWSRSGRAYECAAQIRCTGGSALSKSERCEECFDRLPRIREQYEKAPQPKELIILDGSAHAQYLFQTDQSEVRTGQSELAKRRLQKSHRETGSVDRPFGLKAKSA